MKWQPVLTIAFILLLFSCKSKTAFDYNQQIVKIETEFSAAIGKADNKISRFLAEGKNDSAELMSHEMEMQADKRLKEVQNLDAPDVEEAGNFKKEAVQYFSYLKSIYTAFKKFSMAQTDDAKEKERLRLIKIVKDKEKATKSLQVAQQKFASANHFRIERSVITK